MHSHAADRQRPEGGLVSALLPGLYVNCVFHFRDYVPWHVLAEPFSATKGYNSSWTVVSLTTQRSQHVYRFILKYLRVVAINGEQASHGATLWTNPRLVVAQESSLLRVAKFRSIGGAEHGTLSGKITESKSSCEAPPLLWFNVMHDPGLAAGVWLGGVGGGNIPGGALSLNSASMSCSPSRLSLSVPGSYPRTNHGSFPTWREGEDKPRWFSFLKTDLLRPPSFARCYCWCHPQDLAVGAPHHTLITLDSP